MSEIRFVKPNYPAIRTENGITLMKALLDSGVPVASSCHGEGVCSKCRIQIVAGKENLSPESEAEVSLRERNRISSDCRISCQARLCGDLLVDTPYW